MLGNVLSSLTDPASAEATLALVSQPTLRQRIVEQAEWEAVPVGDLVAATVQRLIDQGNEDVWLDLLSAMSGSPQPGAAAISRILALAFPSPQRVRITRHNH